MNKVKIKLENGRYTEISVNGKDISKAVAVKLTLEAGKIPSLQIMMPFLDADIELDNTEATVTPEVIHV